MMTVMAIAMAKGEHQQKALYQSLVRAADSARSHSRD